MSVHFPKGVRPSSLPVQTHSAEAPVGRVVGPADKPAVPEADALLPTAAVRAPERHTAPQGSSLIDRTQRYLGQQLAKAEAKLAPLVAQLQVNGWFSPETLAGIGRADSKQHVAELIRHSPGAGSLGRDADIDRLSGELMGSPARPASVLLLATSGAALDGLGGTLAQEARASLGELTRSLRHLDNLSTWVDKGFTKYLTLDQVQAELGSAQASAVKQLFEAMAPVSLADVTAAQVAYQNASGASTPQAREAGQAKVLDDFAATLSRMPGPLWSELQGQRSPVRDRLETLLQRGPFGPDFEQARNVVSLFMTNGPHGAGLHALFGKGIDLEQFSRGGYIPDAVGRGAELWE